MGAVPQFAYPHRCPHPLGALRLRLPPDLETVADVDGVWWPYGGDLTREGPHLVNDFPSRFGRIDRLVYAPGDWDVVADEIYTNRGRVKVGFLPAERPGGLVLVRLCGAGILRLGLAPRINARPLTAVRQ